MAGDDGSNPLPVANGWNRLTANRPARRGGRFWPRALADLIPYAQGPIGRLWKIDAAVQLISDIFPFHSREAKSTSPSEVSLRPSEI
jgi:hypothetical protein